jgi:hypothetical protein
MYEIERYMLLLLLEFFASMHNLLVMSFCFGPLRLHGHQMSRISCLLLISMIDH